MNSGGEQTPNVPQSFQWNQTLQELFGAIQSQVGTNLNSLLLPRTQATGSSISLPNSFNAGLPSPVPCIGLPQNSLQFPTPSVYNPSNVLSTSQATSSFTMPSAALPLPNSLTTTFPALAEPQPLKTDFPLSLGTSMFNPPYHPMIPRSSFQRPSLDGSLAVPTASIMKPSISSQNKFPQPMRSTLSSETAGIGIKCDPPFNINRKQIEKKPELKEEDTFEMGKLSTKNYYPTHFMKGSVIRLSNGVVKKVEDMNSDDFLLSAGVSNDLLVEASTLLEMAISSSLVRVTFLVGQPQYESSIEVQLEYPFFVLGKGWSSADPRRTMDSYGMTVQQLKVGDVCITTTRKSEREARDMEEYAVSLLEAQKYNTKEMLNALWRDQLEVDMTSRPSSDSGRSSAPLSRFHPYSNDKQPSPQK